MYLFTRSARLAHGRLAEAMDWAVRVTEKVNQISTTPVNLWSTVFSPGVGTLTWTTFAEDLATLEATEAKCMADGTYLDLVNEGATFAAADAIDDGLVQVVFTERDPAGDAPAYVNVVRAVLAPGAIASGLELGVQIAQRATAVTGCPCSFGAAASGPYGGVVWFTGCESIEQLQQAQQAIFADTELIGLIDEKASRAYLPGVAVQTVYRKIV
ncbi:MAG TPA: hypothetical protein VMR97_15075 [Acidimicrobiales bacterium]|nr:hypothetical protein [Acidimicrobiales bacterium]